MGFDGLTAGADWLSYSLQDFVMFGPQVFLRLFVRINQDVWPWTLLSVVVALCMPWLLMHQRVAWRRLGWALMGIAWASAGYGFLVGYFGPINWPATGFGWAFVAQGGVVFLTGLFVRACSLRPCTTYTVWPWLVAVMGLPWVTAWVAEDWHAVALFGLAPGITTAAGVLIIPLLAGPMLAWLKWIYLLVPLTWALFSAATYWGLHTPGLMITPVATLLLLVVGFWLARVNPSSAQTPD